MDEVRVSKVYIRTIARAHATATVSCGRIDTIRIGIYIVRSVVDGIRNYRNNNMQSLQSPQTRTVLAVTCGRSSSSGSLRVVKTRRREAVENHINVWLADGPANRSPYREIVVSPGRRTPQVVVISSQLSTFLSLRRVSSVAVNNVCRRSFPDLESGIKASTARVIDHNTLV